MSVRTTVVLGLGTVLSVVSALVSTSQAQGKSQAELRKPFIGTWRLVSIEGGAQNAANRGAKPTGIIMYDAHGLMNVQIMPDRPRPKYTGTPTPEQALDAMRGYTAYWGTYTIDEKNQTVTHHRQGMLDSGIVDYVRKFELKDGGNRVVLTPVSGGTTNPPNHLTWERVR
jgi:Lipocalin-like domain